VKKANKKSRSQIIISLLLRKHLCGTYMKQYFELQIELQKLRGPITSCLQYLVVIHFANKRTNFRLSRQEVKILANAHAR